MGGVKGPGEVLRCFLSVLRGSLQGGLLSAPAKRGASGEGVSPGERVPGRGCPRGGVSWA